MMMKLDIITIFIFATKIDFNVGHQGQESFKPYLKSFGEEVISEPLKLISGIDQTKNSIIAD